MSQKEKVHILLQRYGKVNTVVQQPQQVGAAPEMPYLTLEIPTALPLYEYQKRGVAAGLKFRRFINGDEPGIGKTAQGIATAMAAAMIKQAPFYTLVICPSSLKLNWQKEIAMFTGKKSAGVIMSGSATQPWWTWLTVGGARFLICNYESVEKYFIVPEIKQVKPQVKEDEAAKKKKRRVYQVKPQVSMFDAVIIDEFHRLKNPQAAQSQVIEAICKGKTFVMGLTGTPVVNKSKDLLQLLTIIDQLDKFGGRKHFIDRYCSGGESGNADANQAELNYKLLSTCFFRRFKKDVLTELPDKTRVVMKCDITTMPEYNKAKNELAAYLMQFKNKTPDQIERSMRGEIMVRIGVLKSISARGKIAYAKEIIDEHIEAGQKISVFLHQKEIKNELMKLYPNALTITGDDTSEQRNNAVNSFQNDPNSMLILLSIKAAGVGLTLTAASNCIFIEFPWHAADATQCEDRHHRNGQKDNVTCRYLLGDGTIDEWVYSLIEKKRANANGVTGTEETTETEVINYALNLFK
jgi:SWI/SNF-related matrix-associated actin-dependent regulator 1 of chromatin subfamily A